MKQLLHNIIVPFALFSGTLFLVGCNEAQQSTLDESSQETSVLTTTSLDQKIPTEELKSGSMLSIVRDVADMQLKTGEYITQLQDSKSSLEQAVEEKNTVALQNVVQQLNQQLNGFNAALETLNLKSQEINHIRENLLANNQKLLALPWLNGEIDLKDVDLAALETQMGNIQSEVIKLASMLVQNSVEKD